MGEATLDMDRLEEYYVLEASVPTMTAVVPLEIDVVDDLAEGGGGGGQDKLASLGSSGMRVRPEAELWDAWLPITESRKGSTAKAVLHLVCSGIGFQGLSLPVALATLGWAGGITVLTLAFAWQLYTIWILVHLHESPPLATTRYSRYLQVMIHAFGPKLGKLLGIFPVMYLSGGSCVILIITGGGAMRTLFDIFCAEGDTCQSRSLSGAEWFLVFTCIAMAIAQFPNLNSIAGVSLVGAVTGVTYCTILSVLAVRNSRRSGVSYEPLLATAGKSVWTRSGDALYAVGTVALSFRGHNLILEIQGTLPTSPSSKETSEAPMWRAVMISYSIISLCLYPLAIAGFWAYGDKIPSGGMLSAISDTNLQHTSEFFLALVNGLVILNTLTVFPIYAMPVFDNLEIRYTAITGRRRAPAAMRTCLRLFFGGLAFFISVAFPFLPSIGPLIGGLASPLTFAYPCLMWVRIRKPRRGGARRLITGLGCLGLILCVLWVAAALWRLIDKGLNADFFKP